MYMSSKWLGERARRFSPKSRTPPTSHDRNKRSLRNPRIGGHEPTTGGSSASYHLGQMTTLLAVDVGNTNTVLGVFRDDTAGRALADPDRRRADLGRVRGPAEDAARSRWVSVAVDRRRDHLVGRAARACSASSSSSSATAAAPPCVVGPGIKTGMPILYENPREVGADRIVNAVAAYDELEPGHGCIVVDFGTATTWDVVTPKGEYLGGVIAPGHPDQRGGAVRARREAPARRARAPRQGRRAQHRRRRCRPAWSTAMPAWSTRSSTGSAPRSTCPRAASRPAGSPPDRDRDQDDRGDRRPADAQGPQDPVSPKRTAMTDHTPLDASRLSPPPSGRSGPARAG